MKALTIRQPFLFLLECGLKPLEYRSWKTDYRGVILLCASQSEHTPFARGLPRGVATCTADLIEIITLDKPIGNYIYGWKFDNFKKIKPFIVRGQLRLFEVSVNFIDECA